MTGLGWLYGRDMPLICLTFARAMAPDELLRRMGVDPSTIALRTPSEFDREFRGQHGHLDGEVVEAGTYGSWAWASEENSWRCVEDDGLVRRASVGTAPWCCTPTRSPWLSSATPRTAVW